MHRLATLTPLGLRTWEVKAPDDGGGTPEDPGTGWRARPTGIDSYGPNGTWYSPDVPWIKDTFDYTVSMQSATLTSFATAMAAAYKYPGTKKVKVKVHKDWVVQGSGNGSSDKATVFKDYGSKDAPRQYPILIVPESEVALDVKVRLGIRMQNCYDLAIWGWDFEDFTTDPDHYGEGGIVVTDSQRINIMWCTGFFFGCSSSSTTLPTKYVYFYECVTPEMRLIWDRKRLVEQPDGTKKNIPGFVGGDNWAMRGGKNELAYIYMYGCYAAGTHRPVGSDSHTDCIQYSSDWGTEDGWDGVTERYHHFYMYSCAWWSSTNAAIQIGSAKDVFIYHTLAVAERMEQLRYPNLPESSDVVGANCINGSGDSTGNVTGNKSIFVGDVYGPAKWKTVGNSITSDKDPRLPLDSTRWTIDRKYQDTWTIKDYDAICPKPTRTYLKAAWSLAA